MNRPAQKVWLTLSSKEAIIDICLGVGSIADSQRPPVTVSSGTC